MWWWDTCSMDSHDLAREPKKQRKDLMNPAKGYLCPVFFWALLVSLIRGSGIDPGDCGHSVQSSKVTKSRSDETFLYNTLNERRSTKAKCSLVFFHLIRSWGELLIHKPLGLISTLTKSLAPHDHCWHFMTNGQTLEIIADTFQFFAISLPFE